MIFMMHFVCKPVVQMNLKEEMPNQTNNIRFSHKIINVIVINKSVTRDATVGLDWLDF